MDSHLHGFGSHTMQSFPATSRLSTTDGSSGSHPSQETDKDGTRNAGSSSQPETSMDSMNSTYSSAYTRVRAVRPLFPDGSSLLDTDLEAVSALNILSNSPALQKRKKGGREDDNTEQPRTQPKSLFATVVGGSAKKQRKG